MKKSRTKGDRIPKLSILELWKQSPVLLAPVGASLILIASTLLPRIQQTPGLFWTFLISGFGMLVWLFTIIQRYRSLKTGPSFKFVPIRVHYIQACIHLCVYGYWGLHWPNVYPEMPLILAQVIFLYGFDILLTWQRGRGWRMGFGPFPIIFSTNLFLWFKDDWFYWQFIMIAAGALGKEFIRWNKDGKRTHIFNPSAFSLSLFSLGLLVTGQTDMTWAEEVSTTLGNAPHMYLWIFLLGLVVQSLFSVTLMTLSAALTMWLINFLYTQSTGVYFFVDSNIPIAVFLGLHLLFTDPSTSPKTAIGRIIFGSTYGIGVFVLYAYLAHLGLPRFYDKLLCVPIMNLSIQLIDRMVRTTWLDKLQRLADSITPNKLNFTAIAVWIAVFGSMMGSDFITRTHPGGTLQFWKNACDDGKPNGCENYVKLLNHFAEDGFGQARNELGTLYAEGKLVEKDFDRAVTLFELASQVGNLEGSLNLVNASLYFQRPIGQTTRSALSHLEESAASDEDGQINHALGLAYRDGLMGPRDIETALVYFARACELEWRDGCANEAKILLKRADPQSITRAISPLEAGCEADDGFSCYILGTMYLNGNGVPKDLIQARTHFDKACQLGVAQACALAQTLMAEPTSQQPEE